MHSEKDTKLEIMTGVHECFFKIFFSCTRPTKHLYFAVFGFVLLSLGSMSLFVYNRYNLLKIIQRFGEIKNFDLHFHKSGAREGEPSYCFVEFKTFQVRR